MPPVSVEYCERVSNKVAEGTSVFDQEEEEGTVEGDCAFTVHGLTGENLSMMTPTAQSNSPQTSKFRQKHVSCRS